MPTMNRWTRRARTLAGVMILLAAVDVLAVVRDGDLDTSFGNFGKVTLMFPGGLPISHFSMPDVALLPDGKFIVAASVVNASGDEDFAVIRLHANGSLDTSFGLNGGRRIGFDRAGSNNNDVMSGMVVQPDGKVVVVGTVDGDAATNTDFGIVRLTAAGSLDTSFGTGGRAVVSFNLGGEGLRFDTAARVSLQPDGKLLVAGSVDHPDGRRIGVVRLTANGQRDTSFDVDGRVSIDFRPSHSRSAGVRAYPLSSGKIFVAGEARAAVGNDFAVAGLTASGALDATFGTGGRTIFDFAVSSDSDESVYDLVELPDGRVLVCGAALVDPPANYDMACVRFLQDGTPDPSFPAVLVPFDRGGPLMDVAARVRPDAQGRLLLIGVAARSADNGDFAIARLLPSGEPDVSFGFGGQRTHNSCGLICIPAEYHNAATGVALLPDGRILLAGGAVQSNGDLAFQFMRLHGDVLFSDDFEL